MKAAVLYEVGKKLEIIDLKIDKPKDGEVLVDMKAAGVCASDHHVIHGQSLISDSNCQHTPPLNQKSEKGSVPWERMVGFGQVHHW